MANEKYIELSCWLTERYSIESTSEIAGYWQIYDKTLNQTFVLNPDTTTLQRDTNTNKNYIMF